MKLIALRDMIICPRNVYTAPLLKEELIENQFFSIKVIFNIGFNAWYCGCTLGLLSYAKWEYNI